MSHGWIDRLEAAMRERQVVHISRAFEDGYARGYVLDLGPEFFLLALISDRIWFDGFECFRVQDVESVEPDPYVRFVEAALTARSETLPEAPAVRLSSVGDLLKTASQGFPLITVHKERTAPDICHIGQVVGIEGGVLWMLEIDPNAAWGDAASPHRLADITRVNFGGDYEGALALVGGAPPESPSRDYVPLRLVTDDR